MKIKVNRYFGLGIMALCISCAIFGVYIYHWEHRQPLLEAYFFDLNKGRSIFIRTPSNKNILIGGGQTSEVIREITKITPFYKRKIDYLIVPSAMPAQIGGLVEILDRYEIGEIVMPKIMATSTALDILNQKIEKNKIHTEKVARGDSIKIENNLKIDILFPYEGFKFNKTSLPELGIAISYKNASVYLLGNLSKTIQRDILKNIEIKTSENIIEFYNSAIGSKVSPELLQKINPRFTFTTKEKTMHLISDGTEWQKD